MRSEVIAKLHERYERIERAYVKALAGRDPALVNIFDIVPAIFEAVPDTTTDEIAPKPCAGRRGRICARPKNCDASSESASHESAAAMSGEIG
jgi:hypothetical protein